MKTGYRIVLMALTAFGALFPSVAPALTVRTKSDVRRWETVTDRSRPLSWSWTDGADAARLMFSNRLTRLVSSVVIQRTPGATRGECPHPVSPATDEALVVATLVQTAGGVEVVQEVAELAYVPGVCGVATQGVATQPIVVRTRADREWWRVGSPRLAAFDAQWWNLAGPSGHEVLWKTPAGLHRIVREFEGVGVVDEVVLKFGTPGLLMMLR